MRILYKFASRSRPEKFFHVLDNIKDMSMSDNYIVLATLDDDDTSMTEQKERLNKYKNLEVAWGKSFNKIHAINRDMDKVKEWDILVNMSDDMMFIVRNFDEAIRDKVRKHLPDGDCLIHFPDQNQGPNCMTMSVMDRKYFERDKYIYHPSYVSLWCDLEAAEVGKLRGRYFYEPVRIFNHYHPSFFQCAMDDQYKKTESWNVRSADEQTYNYRKANNFFI